MKVATVKISHHESQHYDSILNFYFNKEALLILDSNNIVIDKVNLRIRHATIDDKKTYTINRLSGGATVTAKMPNSDEILGMYEIEDEGNYFQMYRTDQ